MAGKTPKELPDPAVTPFLTVDEALPWLPCGRNAAYAAIKSGELPHVRIGRRVAIPTAALRRLALLDIEPEVMPDADAA